MSKKDKHVQETLAMTADTVGRDLLQALVQEIKLLPDVWPKLSKSKQDDVIDRLRDRIETKVKMAVHLISAEGRTVIAGDLDQITIKDGVKAVIKFSQSAPALHELYECSGKAVLVVVADPAQHTGGMDEIKGEADQRAMDLGKEYKPGSDGEGMGDDITDVKLIGNK
jgi:23S rRNA U2552 (ribose-2'-O)-methylase RlmE/FtsJ